MTDYSRKRCVVCQRTGGIVLQADGLYECGNCGTPYRPRHRKTAIETMTDTHLKDSPESDRFVWFKYKDLEGVERTGLYDFPTISDRERPDRDLDENKLKFFRHLYRTGRLTTEDDKPKE